MKTFQNLSELAACIGEEIAVSGSGTNQTTHKHTLHKLVCRDRWFDRRGTWHEPGS